MVILMIIIHNDHFNDQLKTSQERESYFNQLKRNEINDMDRINIIESLVLYGISIQLLFIHRFQNARGDLILYCIKQETSVALVTFMIVVIHVQSKIPMDY